MIDAKVVLDSIQPDDHRLTTFIITFPRWILAELNTHRVLSRNSASSRARPFSKMKNEALYNTAFPEHWGAAQKGMQSGDELDEEIKDCCKSTWHDAAYEASRFASLLDHAGLHKSLSNRLLEPFINHTALISATEWENFFALRAHKDAQPEFRILAEKMLELYNASEPTSLNWGEWHIPFLNEDCSSLSLTDRLKVATARAAWVSYKDPTDDFSVEKALVTHDKLLEAGHFSPFEHSAEAHKIGSGNFKGFRQYRHTLPYYEARDSRIIKKHWRKDVTNNCSATTATIDSKQEVST